MYTNFHKLLAFIGHCIIGTALLVLGWMLRGYVDKDKHKS